jgi:hypothetical protein
MPGRLAYEQLYVHFVVCSFREPIRIPFFESIIPIDISRFEFEVSWLCDVNFVAETFVVKDF